ncbi:Mrp/NBP35 family ATP-binding protein [bacterium]|nr:Mrp/NBP35 family ATP-binding protein [bacterium]
MEKKILDALSYVDDPDLKKDLVSLNMIRNLQYSDSEVKFDLQLTTPACPMKDMLVNACRNAIHTMVDANLDVQINVTSDVTTSRQNAQVLSGVKNIVAIASGKGGVGKSTVAVQLAKALNRSGAKVGILDADIHGPSIPSLLGIQDEKPELQGERIIPINADGMKVISIGLMVPKEQAIVWRGPMLSNAFKQLSGDVEWGELDYLIIDLPPGTGDVHLSLVQQIPLTGVVVVTSPEDVSVADARKAIAMLTMPQISKPVLGLVENMAYFSPDDQPEKKYFLFGKGGALQLSKEFNLDILAEIPLYEDKNSKAMQDHFMNLAGSMVRQIAILNASN